MVNGVGDVLSSRLFGNDEWYLHGGDSEEIYKIKYGTNVGELACIVASLVICVMTRSYLVTWCQRDSGIGVAHSGIGDNEALPWSII